MNSLNQNAVQGASALAVSKKLDEAGVLAIIEHMFQVVGAPFVREDLEWDEYWYTKHSFTKEQYDEFESWLINHLHKEYKQTKLRAMAGASWLLFMYGFPIKEDNE